MDSGEQISQRFRWTVAILNEPREIKRVTQRFFDQLAPVNDVTTNYESPLPFSNGLWCKIISFSSDRGKLEDPKKVYAADLNRDRALWERPEEQYFKYVEQLSL